MSICCPQPDLKFDWKLGTNELGGFVIAIEGIECQKCGIAWVLEDEAGCLQVSLDRTNFMFGARPLVGLVS